MKCTKCRELDMRPGCCADCIDELEKERDESKATIGRLRHDMLRLAQRVIRLPPGMEERIAEQALSATPAENLAKRDREQQAMERERCAGIAERVQAENMKEAEKLETVGGRENDFNARLNYSTGACLVKEQIRGVPQENEDGSTGPYCNYCGNAIRANKKAT